MSKTRDTREKTKPPSNILKMLVASVSLMAAAVPVVGAFEHWFSAGGTSDSTTSTADYAKVCNLWNERHAEHERQLARFRSAFFHARYLTEARDALLLSADQEITEDSELQASIEALTPASNLASTQRRLEGDWEANLVALRQYRESLRVGFRSTAQLERILIRFPESAIEAKSAEARGQLLRIGGSACSLGQEHTQPVARWSPKLQTLAHVVAPPIRASPVEAISGAAALPRILTPRTTPRPGAQFQTSEEGRAFPTVSPTEASTTPNSPKAATALE